MKSRVTLRDIAAEVGVHYSTISLALRDHPRVSPAVREKIKALAETMGYVPDPALSALNAYRKTKLKVKYQASLAWIDNWHGAHQLRDQPTFNEYFMGASDRARQLGYEVDEFSMRRTPGMTPERASRILHSRGIEGLLLAPQEEPGTWFPLDYEKFAVVSFGYSLTPQAFHLVTNHQYHSMTNALEQLTALGYRKIGLYLHESIDNKADNTYLMGFWRFYHRHPELTQVEPCVVRRGHVDVTLFSEWITEHKPDVVVTDSDVPVMDWIHNLGLKVPEDVGCMWLSLAQDDETYSGIYQNGYIIGRTAVDFLVGMLQRGERGMPETPIRMLVEGLWRPGKTLRTT